MYLCHLQSERAVLAIYDMPWYYFDKQRSGEFLFMYKKAQSPSQITVGGFAELSVCTGQEVRLSDGRKWFTYLIFADSQQNILNLYDDAYVHRRKDL